MLFVFHLKEAGECSYFFVWLNHQPSGVKEYFPLWFVGLHFDISLIHHPKKEGAEGSTFVVWFVVSLEFFHFLYIFMYFSKPLWDVIACMVSNVPLPTPGKDRVLFAVENCLLSVEAPPRDGLPHADVR